MKDESITTIITSVITIIGFVITVWINNKNIKNEFKKNRFEILVVERKRLIVNILKLMKYLENDNNSNEEIINYLEESIREDILAYGSDSQMKIFECYDIAKSNKLIPKNYRAISILSILFCDVKYDLSHQVVDPMAYFNQNIIVWHSLLEPIKKYINKILNELCLYDKSPFKNSN